MLITCLPTLQAHTFSSRHAVDVVIPAKFFTLRLAAMQFTNDQLIKPSAFQRVVWCSQIRYLSIFCCIFTISFGFRKIAHQYNNHKKVCREEILTPAQTRCPFSTGICVWCRCVQSITVNVLGMLYTEQCLAGLHLVKLMNWSNMLTAFLLSHFLSSYERHFDNVDVVLEKMN